ncbi:hypothetical protein K474DRAFT_1064023 [Panus rudis PR-1116 ss-1]|nr:hypothetical protein K474DRAFT_1074595 [Panus rudis PR-1116 ss-1]KAI0069606.1 hypothetical protein K474DRAFT_1064023 [Panus rudis PR-1116 ss-1]
MVRIGRSGLLSKQGLTCERPLTDMRARLGHRRTRRGPGGWIVMLPLLRVLSIRRQGVTVLERLQLQNDPSEVWADSDGKGILTFTSYSQRAMTGSELVSYRLLITPFHFSVHSSLSKTSESARENATCLKSIRFAPLVYVRSSAASFQAPPRNYPPDQGLQFRRLTSRHPSPTLRIRT